MCLLKTEKGSVYLPAVLFLFTALGVLLHLTAVYTVQYKTYESLENTYRHATILLLEQTEASQ